MNNVLLKFGEDISQSLGANREVSEPRAVKSTVDHDSRSAIESLGDSMNANFTSVMSMIERLNGTMSKIVSLLEKQSESKDKGFVVSMDQTIPNLQQYSQPQDLRTIRVEHTPVAPTIATLPRFNEKVEEEVEEEEVEEVVEEVEEEAVEEAVEEEVEEEAVEEWTYKGRSYFKSTDHKVYAVDSDGDPGELLGIYDPVKNLVRKA